MPPNPAKRWAGVAVAIIALLLVRFHFVTLAWTPKVAHLHEAQTILHYQPQRIWFPWNPLITYYHEGRFDHVEDGLYVRFVTGRPLTKAEAFAYLPPDWHGVAVVRGSGDWGLASQLYPPETTTNEAGLWTLTTWK
jgi:hypothetical protein